MTYHVSSYIELMIASDGTNSDICNELICIDGMGEYYYATYDYNITVLCIYWNKLLYVLLANIWR